MNSIGVLLDLENILHRARPHGPDAVRAALAAVMDRLGDLGQVSWAVGSCDWWLARVLLPTAAAVRSQSPPNLERSPEAFRAPATSAAKEQSCASSSSSSSP
jgi:hypothetical protein